MEREDFGKLESLIDQYGLSGVIAAAANVCFEKSGHCAANWQDHGLAKLWAWAGDRTGSLADMIAGKDKITFTKE